MKYKYQFLFILSLLLSSHAFSQIEFSGEANVRAMISGSEKLPFWMHSNQRGRVNDSTTIAAWLSGDGVYELTENSSIELGAGLLYQDKNGSNMINIDELYGQFENSWVQIIAGRKQQKELYDGLSASNGNMVWSLNARPLPGIQIGTLEPIYLFFDKRLGFSGSWAEYHMYKNRYVKNTLLHNKSLFLNYRSNSGFKMKIGIQHFAQWAGTSPDPNIGKQPSGLSDYLRVITGHDGGDNSLKSDQQNALGNHLGSYEFIINKEFKHVMLEFNYSHFFEDGSGMAMYNLLDGRYGIYSKFKNRSRYDFKKKWIESAMYEFYYTKDQSHNLTPWEHLWDNYFNNGVYKSGWSYNNQIIGVPFFTTNIYEGDATITIGNNRVIVHHLGLNGFAFNQYPYKFLVSYRNNNGHVRNRGEYDYEYYREDDPRGKFTVPHEIISTYLDIRMLKSVMNLNLEVGADVSAEKTNLGIGIKLNKVF